MKRATLIISAILLLLSVSPIKAQDSHQDNVNDMAPEAGANIAKFNLDSSSTWFSAVGCNVAAAGCIDEQTEKPILTTSGVDFTAGYIASIISDPPVSSATYVADLLQNAGFIKPAYAQGVGFTGLSPILGVWKAFRNIAYFLFIIIFVIIGFMIMIRKKISNNAVLTIQEALPKIILTLIMITFSYAIAGLLIDLMYLSIFAITGIFQQTGIISNADQARNILFGRNIIAIGWNNFMGPNDVGGEASQAIGKLVEDAVGGGKILKGLANGLGYLVIAVAIFIALFRTLFALITAYVSIILSVIFAPIRLIMNALPGNDAFGPWFKGLFANIIIFPTVAVMILIGIYLGGAHNDDQNSEIQITSDNILQAGQTDEGFVPPFIANRDSSGDPTAVRSIIGLGIILLLPEVVKLVKEALQVKETDFGGTAMKNAQGGWSPVYGYGIKRPVDTYKQQELEYRQAQQEAFYHDKTYSKPNLKTRSEDYLKRLVGLPPLKPPVT